VRNTSLIPLRLSISFSLLAQAILQTYLQGNDTLIGAASSETGNVFYSFLVQTNDRFAPQAVVP
jgi:hypothetical protein